MPLNFPNSPGIGSVYTDTTSGFSYEWDGTVWKSYSAASSSQIRILDDISSSFTGIAKTFALASSGTSIIPASSQSLLISLGGVLQEPGVDYTISTSNIVFDEAPAAGLNFGGVSLGPAIPITTIADGTITQGSLTVAGILSATNLRVAGLSTFTDGPVIVGSSSSTGTASQRLQVTGGAYVSGLVGIGRSNPSAELDVFGRAVIGGTGVDSALYFRRVTDNTVGLTIGYASTNSNSETSLRHNTGTGNFTIHLNGTGGEQGNGFNEKFRFTSGGSLGIGRSNPSAELDVFGGANFTNRVLIGSATSTGTASQPLQVTGGAYVSGNLGINSTSPTSRLDVVGDAKFSGIVTATEFDITGSTNTFTAGGLNVGVATATTFRVGTAVTINSSGINVAGVVTANDYDGNFILDSYLFN